MQKLADFANDFSGLMLSVVAILLALCPFADSRRAAAQSLERPSIDVAITVRATPNVETGFPVRVVSGSSALPTRATLLILGIPATLKLSEGRVFDSGVWFVPAKDLPRLKITATNDAAGLRAPLTFSLVAIDGTVLAEARSTLAVNRAIVPETTAAAAIGPMPQPIKSTAVEVKITPAEQPKAAVSPLSGKAAPVTPASVISPAEEAERLKSGQAALALDDIAGARLILEYLAQRGSAAGAYQLAQTYDPQALGRKPLGGQFKPDEAVAAKWYARAAELGHAEAAKKIAGRR